METPPALTRHLDRRAILKSAVPALALACSAAFAALPVRAAGGGSPAALVETFHEQLLGVMKAAKTLGYQGRYDRLTSPIHTAFHLRLMTQISSGSYWRKATEAEKTALVTAFSKVSIGTYASRFTGFSGQRFETLGTKPGPQETELVSTRIVNPDGDNVPLTYVTKVVGGGWQIIDVILDTGISELAVRRSEYRKILKQSGIEGLIASLNAKAVELGTTSG